MILKYSSPNNERCNNQGDDVAKNENKEENRK